MKEMNKEMQLNMDELEQVNGGETMCYDAGCIMPCFYMAELDEPEYPVRPYVPMPFGPLVTPHIGVVVK